MTVPTFKRKQACRWYMDSGFDAEGTIARMLDEFADDPAIARARNKEKLCRNIITMGGNGLNFEANQNAFQGALLDFVAAQRAKADAEHQAKMREITAERDSYRERAADAEARATAKTDEVIDLERKLANAERQTLTLRLQAAEEAAAAA